MLTAQVSKLWVLLALTVISLFLAFSVGAIPLPVWEILRQQATDLQHTVFFEIRAPRVLLAAGVGAMLGLSGACLQGLFRNPLADPTLIGVSAGAALGAIAMIVLGDLIDLPAGWAAYAVPLAAVAGALLVTSFLYGFAAWFGQFSIVTLLLVGIAVNALSTVGIGAFEYLSDDRQLRNLVFWMMGSFGRAGWDTVIPALLVMSAAGILLIRQGRQLDLLQLGEAEAAHLGINVGRLKRVVILMSAVAVGAGVALSGIIGFVGLIVPHLVRLMIGPLHRYLLAGSLLLGAGLMVLADLLARTVIVPAELPVSLVTSALGAPFFLWLIARMRRR